MSKYIFVQVKISGDAYDLLWDKRAEMAKTDNGDDKIKPNFPKVINTLLNEYALLLKNKK